MITKIDVIEKTRIFQTREGRVSFGVFNTDVVLVGLRIPLDLDDIAALTLEAGPADALSTGNSPFHAAGVVSQCNDNLVSRGCVANADLGCTLAVAILAKTAMTPARKMADFMIFCDQLDRWTVL